MRLWEHAATRSNFVLNGGEPIEPILPTDDLDWELVAAVKVTIYDETGVVWYWKRPRRKSAE
jgi:hypothetical protein